MYILCVLCPDVQAPRRFLHRLDAPTAVIEESGSSLTYLNKGAHYTLLVQDTSHSIFNPDSKTYRTAIQIAFDTEIQRQCPSKYWRLWAEGRGTDESHYIDGKLQAIHHIDSKDCFKRNLKPQLQDLHSDGFSLVWSAEPGVPRECVITFQINLLSTDFSHSKGVHGVALRLCSKTEEISTDTAQLLVKEQNMNFCRIKLFRCHGAERKTNNDLAVTDRKIKRLKKHLSLSLGTNELRPRENKGSRRLSVDGGPSKRKPITDECSVRSKIKVLQETLGTPRVHSFLDQQGSKQENYDWYYVESNAKESLSSEHGTKGSSPDQWSDSMLDPMDPVITPSMSVSSLDVSSTIKYSPPWNFGLHRDKSVRLTVDSFHQESIDIRQMVACFYIRVLKPNKGSLDDAYTAIYLSELTAFDLKKRIAVAASVDLTKVLRIIWRSRKGMNIIVDDDVVVNIPEGQNMEIDITKFELKPAGEGHPISQSASQVEPVEPFKQDGDVDVQQSLQFTLVF